MHWLRPNAGSRLLISAFSGLVMAILTNSSPVNVILQPSIPVVAHRKHLHRQPLR
jgi:hypothetical protein